MFDKGICNLVNVANYWEHPLPGFVPKISLRTKRCIKQKPKDDFNLSMDESFSAFLPRFAGKCDPQSRDLTQLPRGYNFAVKPATNNPSSS